MENNKDGILLETGTNEIEIMEFTIDGNLYGINVAKVREIMLSAPVHPMPHAHPAVEGIFKPRDIVITVVDLPEYLSGHTEPKGEKDLFIITNFNKMHIAFRVHTVVGISRISWRDIQKPDNTVSGGADGVATGIAQCGKDLVWILKRLWPRLRRRPVSSSVRWMLWVSGRSEASRSGSRRTPSCCPR